LSQKLEAGERRSPASYGTLTTDQMRQQYDRNIGKMYFLFPRVVQKHKHKLGQMRIEIAASAKLSLPIFLPKIIKIGQCTFDQATDDITRVFESQTHSAVAVKTL